MSTYTHPLTRDILDNGIPPGARYINVTTREWREIRGSNFYVRNDATEAGLATFHGLIVRIAGEVNERYSEEPVPLDVAALPPAPAPDTSATVRLIGELGEARAELERLRADAARLQTVCAQLTDSRAAYREDRNRRASEALSWQEQAAFWQRAYNKLALAAEELVLLKDARPADYEERKPKAWAALRAALDDTKGGG